MKDLPVGLFRPYQQAEPADNTPADAAPGGPAGPGEIMATEARRTTSGRKAGPTPSRREAEAARMERLHPTLTKKELREREREAENRRRSRAMASYEDRPERTLMRNYVDSRRSFTEHMWPILLLLLIASVLGSWVQQIVVGVTIAMWVAIAGAALNIYLFWSGFQRELRMRHPGTSSKGLFFTFASRMMTMRRFRNPGVAVKVGGAY